MKTKTLPAIVMLLAGAIASIVGFVNHYELGEFLKLLLIVLIVFYFLGLIIKLILDKNIGEMELEEILQQENEQPSDEMENIDLEKTAADESAETDIQE